MPVFVSSISVTFPSHNLLSAGLAKGEKQGDLMLYPTTFSADYDDNTDLRNDRTATDMQYSSATNVKEEIEKQTLAPTPTPSRATTRPASGPTCMCRVSTVSMPMPSP